MRGLFITFEGADGCGKSTQLRFLAEYLEEQGVSVVCTREPGGCPVSEKIRGIVLGVGNEMDAVTEAMLYAASRAAHVRQVIRPALDAGQVVLCDRFIHSSLAYQGYGRELGVELVSQINAPAVDGCMPDATVFINIPPERAFERMNEHKVYDRLESEDIAFHRRAYDGFTELSKGPGIISIDAKGTKHETQEIIRESLIPLFKKAGIL
jgi:dTMP kinase